MPVMFAILFIFVHTMEKPFQKFDIFSIEIMSSMGSFKQIVHD